MAVYMRFKMGLQYSCSRLNTGSVIMRTCKSISKMDKTFTSVLVQQSKLNACNSFPRQLWTTYSYVPNLSNTYTSITTRTFITLSSKNLKLRPCSNINIANQCPINMNSQQYFTCHSIERYLFNCIQRHFHSSRSKFNKQKFDPNEQSRRRKLMSFTYLSCFIGICLLSVVGYDQYGKIARKAVGMKEIKIREYGRRAKLFSYRGFIFPDFIVNDIRNVHDFAIREDDIWVCSFPKAGTTWVQEIVYLISSDLDFQGAEKKHLDERFPYFEFIFPGKKVIDSLQSPRFIKTHLPFSLLPREFKEKKPKIIYVFRNPKDTVLSYHRFATEFLGPINTFQGDFERYCELFADDMVAYGPWWKHILDAWKYRDEENVLIVSYEDMQKDISSIVRQIAQFLGKQLNEGQIDKIIHHCSFESMKKNASVNYNWLKEQGMAKDGVDFMRKGRVGDWENKLSDEIVSKLDEVVCENLTPAGIVIQDRLMSENTDKVD